MEFKTNSRENLYFGLRIFFTLIGALILVLIFAVAGEGGASGTGSVMILSLYAVLIISYFLFSKIFLIGYLKGNGVPVSEKQFPDAYRMIGEIGAEYGMKKVPGVFLLQGGGILNAFAARFSGKNYVAIYSDMFSIIYDDPAVVKFVLAHELAHVVKKHNEKRFWTALSGWVPFLGAAYSRACEYTCDNYANAVSPDGAKKGLVVLAAGRDVYKKIDVELYLSEAQTNNTGVVKFTQLFLSHPYLPNRVRNIK